jgi:plasmid stabilization system protein ParE
VSDEEIRYEVVWSEPAEIQRDTFCLNIVRQLGPEFATRWYTELERRAHAITEFPGPLALAVDEEASRIFRTEVRRELYYGPGRRRSSGATYRILFTIKPPLDEGDPHTILILRVLHGAQLLSTPDTGGENDTNA